MTNKLLERIDLRLANVRVMETNLRVLLGERPDDSSSDSWLSWETRVFSLIGVARIRLFIAERLIRATLPMGEERDACMSVFWELLSMLSSLDEDVVTVILAGEVDDQ